MEWIRASSHFAENPAMVKKGEKSGSENPLFNAYIEVSMKRECDFVFSANRVAKRELLFHMCLRSIPKTAQSRFPEIFPIS